MSKFLKKCGYFFVLLIAMNVLYLLMLLAFSPGFRKINEISSFKNKNYNLLVLGNSMALDGIDSEYLTNQGLSTYNLSVAGDHSATSLMLLDRYLQQNKKPEMVMVGLSSAIGQSYLNKVPFQNPEVEFFYNPSVISNITNPPLLNFQWLFVDLIKILISKDHRHASFTLGQWKTKKVIPDNSVYHETTSKKIDYSDPYLLEIIKLCKSNGISVFLVEMPASNAARNNFPFIYDAGLKNPQPVYNLNNFEVSSKIINPQTDWLAADHLNQYGASKVTAYLYLHVLKTSLRNRQ